MTKQMNTNSSLNALKISAPYKNLIWSRRPNYVDVIKRHHSDVAPKKKNYLGSFVSNLITSNVAPS